MQTKQQRELPFEGSKEAMRLERVNRIMSGKLRNKITTAARMFDEAAYVEASERVRRLSSQSTPERERPLGRN